MRIYVKAERNAGVFALQFVLIAYATVEFKCLIPGFPAAPTVCFR